MTSACNIRPDWSGSEEDLYVSKHHCIFSSVESERGNQQGIMGQDEHLSVHLRKTDIELHRRQHFLSFFLSFFLSVFLSFCLSFCLSFFLSFCLSVFLYKIKRLYLYFFYLYLLAHLSHITMSHPPFPLSLSPLSPVLFSGLGLFLPLPACLTVVVK